MSKIVLLRSKNFSLFFLLAFLIGVLVVVKWQTGNTNQSARFVKLMVNNQTLNVELVRSEEEITKGLGGKEELGEKEGMLFIFLQPGKYQFWMKEMKFNLDAVFISGEKVVDLVENISYPKNGEQPKKFGTEKEFDKVLEIKAGAVGKLGIKIGDTVRISE